MKFEFSNLNIIKKLTGFQKSLDEFQDHIKYMINNKLPNFKDQLTPYKSILYELYGYLYAIDKNKLVTIEASQSVRRLMKRLDNTYYQNITEEPLYKYLYRKINSKIIKKNLSDLNQTLARINHHLKNEIHNISVHDL